MSNPNLSDEEVNDICAGLEQNAAKVRYLRSIGLVVMTKPNGRPLVSRGHYETLMGGAPVAQKKSGIKWTEAA